MGIIAWLLIGLVAGLIARALVPGRDKLGIWGTILLGLVGSVVGGFIGDALTEGNQDFSPAGILGSIVGAVIALVAYRAMTGRNRSVTR
ncbi:MAG: GlsB/YeaQ/YmgE family stress response membrane protein [Actinobacteria bacterium]|nr:GlsB/YeaQ/YmgE family stress response membrane protein [Actinomycetota bacterium]